MAPNPTKTIVLDFPLEKVNAALRQIPRFHSRFNLKSFDTTTNFARFKPTTLMSIYTMLDVHTHAEGEAKTQISIEARKTFGTWAPGGITEHTAAGKNINNLISALSSELQRGAPSIESSSAWKKLSPEELAKRKKLNKILIFSVIGLVIILGLLAKPTDKKEEVTDTQQAAAPSTQTVSPAQSDNSSATATQSASAPNSGETTFDPVEYKKEQEKEVLARIKQASKDEYPDDYTLQKFNYEQEVKAYHFMQKVPDLEIKRRCEEEYPTDYSLQKFNYQQEVKAKRAMQ